MPVESAIMQNPVIALARTAIAAPTCRSGCGACCTAPSISSAIPGMPAGKPAGVRCIQLDAANACRIFADPARPAVCASLQPAAEMCGASRAHAMQYLARLERLTAC
jgi:Fe-S-cluster containining protein